MSILEEKKTNEEPATKKLLRRITSKNKNEVRDIQISRVPKKTFEEFKELAEKEFCGDYGMLLKFLMDGILSEDMIMVVNRLNELHDRLCDLEDALKEPALVEPENNNIKLANGRVIKRA